MDETSSTCTATFGQRKCGRGIRKIDGVFEVVEMVCLPRELALRRWIETGDNEVRGFDWDEDEYEDVEDYGDAGDVVV